MSDLRQRIEADLPKRSNSVVLIVATVGSLLLFVFMIWFIVPKGEPNEVAEADRVDPFRYDPSTDPVVTDEGTDSTDSSENGVDYREAVVVGLYSWQVIAEDFVPADDLPEYHEIVEDRVLVKLNDNLWTKDVGDVIQFAIPQLEEVLVGTITSADTDQINYRSLEGTITEADKEFTFVVTLGENVTFAHINTMSGSFELVANETYGWLMPTDKMDQNVDYSVPDHFLPDPDPHSHVLEPAPPQEQ